MRYLIEGAIDLRLLENHHNAHWLFKKKLQAAYSAMPVKLDLRAGIARQVRDHCGNETRE